MKTLLRTLLYLALIVWLGAEIFFPVVAAVAFSTLPDTHAAGTIVGQCLRVLHNTGMIAVLMIAGTAYSQYSIMPRMERDRIAAGGAINTRDTASPYTRDFNRLHNRSTTVEETVLLLGIATVALVAYAETARA